MEQGYKLSDLIHERDMLKDRLNWLGLKSEGSEKLEKRIKELNARIQEVINKDL